MHVLKFLLDEQIDKEREITSFTEVILQNSIITWEENSELELSRNSELFQIFPKKERVVVCSHYGSYYDDEDPEEINRMLNPNPYKKELMREYFWIVVLRSVSRKN